MLHITLDLTDDASEGLILSQIKESDDITEIKNNNQWLMVQNAFLGNKLHQLNKQLEDCKKFIMGEKI